MNKEKWKDIEGYAGLYKISTYGRVKSFYKNGRILSAGMSNGYYHVSLYKNSKSRSFKIHNLVAKHFIQNEKDLPCINHIDSDKLNNNVNNLEWCTQQHNIDHSIKKGLTPIGEELPYCKLKNNEVLDIRAAWNIGCFTQKELGDAFNVSSSYISEIVNFKKRGNL